MNAPARADPADLDLPISTYLAQQPHAVAILLDLRMGCLGCDFIALDTLRQALEAHAIPLPQYFDRLSRSSPPVRAEPLPTSPSGDSA